MLTIVILATVILYAVLVMDDTVRRVSHNLDKELHEIRLFTLDVNENATLMS